MVPRGAVLPGEFVPQCTTSSGNTQHQPPSEMVLPYNLTVTPKFVLLPKHAFNILKEIGLNDHTVFPYTAKLQTALNPS